MTSFVLEPIEPLRPHTSFALENKDAEPEPPLVQSSSATEAQLPAPHREQPIAQASRAPQLYTYKLEQPVNQESTAPDGSVKTGYRDFVLEPTRKERNFLSRNFLNSATGILASAPFGRGLSLDELREMELNDPGIISRLSDSLAQITSDLPFFHFTAIPGAAAGAKTGGSIGSLFSPAGSAIGALIGAAVGGGASSFAARKFVTKTYRDWLENKEAGGEQSFTDFFKVAAKAAYDSKDAAFEGALVGAAGMASKFLKIPKEQVIKSVVTDLTAETAALTLGHALTTGELPTGTGVLENVILLSLLKAQNLGMTQLQQKGRQLLSQMRNSKAEAAFASYQENLKSAGATDEQVGDLFKSQTLDEFDARKAEIEKNLNLKQAPDLLRDIANIIDTTIQVPDNQQRAEGDLDISRFRNQQSATLESQNLSKEAVALRDRVEAAQSRIESLGESLDRAQDQKPAVEKEIAKATRVRDELAEQYAEALRSDSVGNRPRPLEPDPAGFGPAPSRKEIRDLFGEKIAPIRFGKLMGVGKETRGHYKPAERIIRARSRNDIETIAHEIGHDIGFRLLGGEEKAKEALKPYFEEVEHLGAYEPKNHEIFADFTRLYVTNANEAQRYKGIYKYFEDLLQAKNPEVLNALREARGKYAEYLAASPEGRVESQIEFSRFRNQWVETARQFFRDPVLKLRDGWRKGYTYFVDSFYPLKTAIADALGVPPRFIDDWKNPLNAYRAARLLSASSGKTDVFINHQTFDFETLKENGEPLRAITNELKTEQEYRDFSAYLVARRIAGDLDKRNIESGIDVQDARTTVQRFRRKYDALAKRLDAYQSRVLQYSVKGGMLSRKSYKEIKRLNRSYIPFGRVFEEFEQQPNKRRGDGSFDFNAKEIARRIYGSDRRILDPISTVAENTNWIIRQTERNRVARKLVMLSKKTDNGLGIDRIPEPQKVTNVKKAEILSAVLNSDMQGSGPMLDQAVNALSELLPDSLEIWRAGQPSNLDNTLILRESGQKLYFEVPLAIKELTKAPSDFNFLTKFLAAPARLQKAGITLDPRFAIRNFVRDFQDGLLFSKYQQGTYNKLLGPIKGLFDVFNRSDLYIDFLKSGAGQSGFTRADRTKATDPTSKNKSTLHKLNPVEQMRFLGEVSEDANRIAEFRAALAVEGTSREAMEIAAYAARDLSIDFMRIGSKMRVVNRIVNFTNARIQGFDKLIREMSAGKFYANAMYYLVLPTVYEWLANRGDQEIRELPTEIRDESFIFRAGKNDLVRIPVPFEAGLVFHGLTWRALEYLDGKGFDAKDFLSNAIAGVTPGVIPSTLKGPLEVFANYDIYRKRAIVPQHKMGMATRQRTGHYTTTTAKMISAGLEALNTSAKYDSTALTPAAIDHYVNSFGGGLGRLLTRFSDELLHSFGLKPEVQPTENFFDRLKLNPFGVSFPNSYAISLQKFDDNYHRAQIAYRTIREYAKQGDATNAEKAFTDLYIPKLDRQFEGMRNMRSLIANTSRRPDLTPNERRDLIKDTLRKMIAAAQKINSEMEKELVGLPERKKEQLARK